MSFPRYESYNDSGVEWLGEVPSHWEVSRVRHLFKMQKQGISGTHGYDVLSITHELLKERRTALISAAVTGKIDVRTFAT